MVIGYTVTRDHIRIRPRRRRSARVPGSWSRRPIPAAPRYLAVDQVACRRRRRRSARVPGSWSRRPIPAAPRYLAVDQVACRRRRRRSARVPGPRGRRPTPNALRHPAVDQIACRRRRRRIAPSRRARFRRLVVGSVVSRVVWNLCRWGGVWVAGSWSRRPIPAAPMYLAVDQVACRRRRRRSARVPGPRGRRPTPNAPRHPTADQTAHRRGRTAPSHRAPLRRLVSGAMVSRVGRIHPCQRRRVGVAGSWSRPPPPNAPRQLAVDQIACRRRRRRIAPSRRVRFRRLVVGSVVSRVGWSRPCQRPGAPVRRSPSRPLGSRAPSRPVVEQAACSSGRGRPLPSHRCPFRMIAAGSVASTVGGRLGRMRGARVPRSRSRPPGPSVPWRPLARPPVRRTCPRHSRARRAGRRKVSICQRKAISRRPSPSARRSVSLGPT